MDRIRSGCPQAAEDLHAQYSPHVRRIVRRRLGPRLRSQFDSVDFLQQVWKSFFAGDLCEHDFDTPEALVGYLCRTATHQIYEEYRRNGTQKRDLNRVNAGREDGYFDVIAPRQATPSQEVVAGERFERLMADQPPDVRRILEMLRAGYTHDVIARAVGINKKTIQRLLDRLSRKHGQP
jgi:RNA polymerase sigma factor (sigma-70 family)